MAVHKYYGDQTNAQFTTTATRADRCLHLTGWYVTVEFLWLFNRRIYVCSDCGENLPGDFKAPNDQGKPLATTDKETKNG